VLYPSGALTLVNKALAGVTAEFQSLKRWLTFKHGVDVISSSGQWTAILPTAFKLSNHPQDLNCAFILCPSICTLHERI
jgi:hypothetical protein